jgi:lysozyme family protein
MSALMDECGERLYSDEEIIKFLANAKKNYPFLLEYFNIDLYNSNAVYRFTANYIFSISSIYSGDRLISILNAYDNNKYMYESISEQTGLPPEILAVFHYRECEWDYLDGTFGVCIQNGDPLGVVTTNYPQGLLFYSFEESALYEFQINDKSDNYHAYNIGILDLDEKPKDIIAMTAYINLYNGMDWRISSYIYSGTDIYSSGRFVADGEYDSESVDEKLGAFAILVALLRREGLE